MIFKFNNRDTRKSYEICYRLTIKTPERHHLRCPGVFIVNFEHISHLFSSVPVINFEQVNVSWEQIINYTRRCDNSLRSLQYF